jgi:hypothetical protein
MTREEAAYHAMHKEWYAQSAGQHVAIFQGKLGGYDEDGGLLYQRMRQKYPGQFVLITPVDPTPEETYRILSPRLAVE